MPRFCTAWLQEGSGVFGLSPDLLGSGAGGGVTFVGQCWREPHLLCCEAAAP